MKSAFLSLLILTTISARPALCGGPAASGDWPRWMGPEGDGVGVAEQGSVFGGETMPVLRESWRRPIGRGFSSISVAGNRAFTMELDGRDDYVVALDARDGRVIWRFKIDHAADDSVSLGPLSTPTIDQGRVFALNARGKFQVLSVDDGQPLWSVDVAESFGAKPPDYGISTSPLIEGDLVLLLVGGRTDHNLVAFDKVSGERAWSVFHAGLGSHSSPLAGTLAGRRQVVVPAGDRLYAVLPASGDLLWTHGGLSYPDRNPLLLAGDQIFMPLQEAGVMLEVKSKRNGFRVEESWRTRLLKDSYSQVVHLDGWLYGFDDYILTCLHAGSGDVRWRRTLFSGSLILVDGHLLILNMMNGRLHVAPATPEDYKELLVTQVFENEARSFTPPSFSAGRIFFRNQREVAVLEIERRDSEQKTTAVRIPHGGVTVY